MYNPVSSQQGIKRMLQNRPSGLPRQRHGPAQQVRIRHHSAVIGVRGRASRGQGGQIGEFAAGPAAGDTGRRQHGIRPTLQHPDLLRRVARRLGVGHGEHRPKPAARRGPGAGQDGLSGLVAGFTQVDVQVDKGRHQHQAVARHDPLVRHPHGGGRHDGAAVQAEVAPRLPPGRRVHDPDILEEPGFHGCGAVREMLLKMQCTARRARIKRNARTPRTTTAIDRAPGSEPFRKPAGGRRFCLSWFSLVFCGPHC